jgi:putative transposase
MSEELPKAQAKVSKLIARVANQRQNWLHQIAADIVSSNSFVATEKLEVKNMTAKAKIGKRRKRKLGGVGFRPRSLPERTSPRQLLFAKVCKKQKAGLNKSILDVGFGMLRNTIKYKIDQIGGVFVEVPTKKVKPSQTCPKCGHQHKKTLDIWAGFPTCSDCRLDTPYQVGVKQHGCLS